MKKPNLTRRDLKFFLLGIAAVIAIDIVTDWEAHKKAFREGREDAAAGKAYQFE
ncbi:MAG: hypothetical protein LPK07_11270 [Hymenobacteraceae bacterium]|nr:hypothetical protein [Hymenobacteraceae bacterium]